MSATRNTETSRIRRPRILALDGGGVRGLSSLLILRDLMRRLERRRGQHLRPSDCFELIIGTGTGALSALFLGRLGMTVDEAITEYTNVAEKAFEPSYKGVPRVFTGRKALLDGNVLEREIGDVVARYAGSCDARIANTEPGATHYCHTAVLAATAAYADSPPHVFRSYASGSRAASLFTIREVARATAATASFFPPVELGDPAIKFVDAGVAGYNNPTEVGLDEAATLWPGSRTECVVSLGTGLQNIVSVGDAWSEVVEACRQTLQSCEVVHDRMGTRGRREDFPYFRFNVDRGLHSIDITEWRRSGSRGQLAGITEAYTRWAEVEHRLDKCVRVLIRDDFDSAHITSDDSSIHQTTDAEASLPGVPPVFHGRRNRIGTAVEVFLRENAARLALLGAGGIGKTSIALKILHEPRIERKFGQHRYFLSCEGIRTLSLLIDSMSSTFSAPPDSDRICQRTKFLAFMRQRFVSCPALLVLDNFETVWDVAGVQTEVEDFLQGLGDVKMLSLLLTMRGTEYPGGLRWSSPRLPEVQPLDPDAARAAFEEICGHGEIESHELDDLLRDMDYVPLVVTLMARLAQNESLAELSKRWKTEHTKLLSRRRHEHRLTNVDVSIRVSLESHRMKSTPEALLLLSTISMFPSGAFDNNLASICPRIPNLSEASLTLREAALVYQDAARTLRVLSPIRLYIMEHHPPEPEHIADLESFHFKLASEGRRVPNTLYKDTVGILTQAGRNIEAVIIQALSSGRDGGAVQAALDWTHFLRWTHHPRTTVIEAAVQYFRKQGELGNDRLAECLCSQGDTHRLRHEYGAAQTTLSQARDRYEACGDLFGAAECLWSLGGVWTLTGKYNEAEAALALARDRYESVDNLHRVASCLRSLGDIWRRRGRYDEAEEVLTQARDQYDAFGDLLGVARCLWSLGEVRQRKGDYGTAEEALAQARDWYESLGDPHRVASCLRSLGDVWQRSGRYDEAEEALTRARYQYELFGDLFGVARCLGSLGELWRRRSKYDEAVQALSQARDQYASLGALHGVADCLRSLGKVWRSDCQYEKAEEALTQAQVQYEFLGAMHGVADCLLTLGMVHHAQARYPTAKECLIQAFQMLDHNGCGPGRARTLLLLGYISRDLQQLKEAKRYFVAAKTAFEEVGSSMRLEHEECLNALSTLEEPTLI